MQAAMTALQADNDHLTQLAQVSHTLRTEKSRLARTNHQLSQTVLRAIARCGEVRNQVMWLNSRIQQTHTTWTSTLDGLEHQLHRAKNQWWAHRSLVCTGQNQQQTLVARIKGLEAQLHKAQQDHQTVQRQWHSGQEECQQLQSRLEHQQTLVTELEERCQFWQDKVMTLQRSVTTAIEEKSQAVMESHRVRLELEKSRVAEFSTNGSACGSVVSSRYGGRAPSVASVVSVTSMVRARRARQHPYSLGHRASTQVPPHSAVPRSHRAMGDNGDTKTSGPGASVSHVRPQQLGTPTLTPADDQWSTTPASALSMHPPPLPVAKPNWHKATHGSLLFTTPVPGQPETTSPLTSMSPTLFSPSSRAMTQPLCSPSPSAKPLPPPMLSYTGAPFREHERKGSEELTSPLVNHDRQVASPSLRSTDSTRPLSLPPRQKMAGQPITVMFSGFGDADRRPERVPNRAYTFATRDRLAELVTALGGTVHSEHHDFDPGCVTHLITRPTSRTLKTFAAALTGCWVITNCEWVEQSAKAGQFVDERPFGTRYHAQPFARQQVYIAPSFEQSNQGSAAFKMDNIKALVEKYGSGQMVTTATDASLCIKADWDRQSYCSRDLTWAQFVALIPGSNVKSARTRMME
ncbi:hypothetical protein H4R34_004515 [Dimargaris verticillata]|uniref:BRCT domain-containing protein n=1 Tax=Dimargaris verticillata TaxID=2761393 RepID=A0A9W8E820_9FUNG|nr:hypothetical protein H4R34_004515 [Dimargaris verticillata]